MGKLLNPKVCSMQKQGSDHAFSIVVDAEHNATYHEVKRPKPLSKKSAAYLTRPFKHSTYVNKIEFAAKRDVPTCNVYDVKCPLQYSRMTQILS